MRIGSLFSGIGGLEFGLEMACVGHTVWQVEADAFRRSVLATHWPEVDRSVTDVREANAGNLFPVDLICGGFPCQDLSHASRGRGAGLSGERSGLWREYSRIVGEFRPRFVVVENVANAAVRWLRQVRCDLHVRGYRTRAVGVGARDVGAPHARARVFVIGYSDTQGQSARSEHAKVAGMSATPGPLWPAWPSAPARERVADGVSAGLDRPRNEALGDAVMPRCAEVIGRIIMNAA